MIEYIAEHYRNNLIYRVSTKYELLGITMIKCITLNDGDKVNLKLELSFILCIGFI